jgi:hypothetical protein
MAFSPTPSKSKTEIEDVMSPFLVVPYPVTIISSSEDSSGLN